MPWKALRENKCVRKTKFHLVQTLIQFATEIEMRHDALYLKMY